MKIVSVRIIMSKMNVLSSKQVKRNHLMLSLLRILIVVIIRLSSFANLIQKYLGDFLGWDRKKGSPKF